MPAHQSEFSENPFPWTRGIGACETLPLAGLNRHPQIPSVFCGEHRSLGVSGNGKFARSRHYLDRGRAAAGAVYGRIGRFRRHGAAAPERGRRAYGGAARVVDVVDPKKRGFPQRWPSACKCELRFGRIDPLYFGWRASLSEQLGERATAAADVDPSQARGQRQPIQETYPASWLQTPIPRS
jgi:hypothetical protein